MLAGGHAGESFLAAGRVTMLQETQAKVDAALVMGGVSAPWWLQLFDYATQHLLFWIAVAIGISRLAIMWLQYRNGRKAD